MRVRELITAALAVALTATLGAQSADAPTFEAAAMKRNASGDISSRADVLPSGEVRIVNNAAEGELRRAPIARSGPGCGRPRSPATDRLTGFYQVTLRFQRMPPRPDAAASPDDLPSVFTAVQEQLGLKLQADTADVKVLVIDRLERPSEN